MHRLRTWLAVAKLTRFGLGLLRHFAVNHFVAVGNTILAIRSLVSCSLCSWLCTRDTYLPSVVIFAPARKSRQVYHRLGIYLLSLALERIGRSL